jgi:hypothetical protein
MFPSPIRPQILLPSPPMSKRRRVGTRLPLIFLLCAPLAVGQLDRIFEPVGAHIFQFFPQFADGGPPQDRWLTTIALINPGAESVTVALQGMNAAGVPLSIDFGGGAATVHTMQIPAHGSRKLRSLGRSSQVVTGWIQVAATSPIFGTLFFKRVLNGIPQTEISVPPVLPSAQHLILATRELGIAAVNLGSRSLPVRIEVFDDDGRQVGSSSDQISPNGQLLFNLGTRFPALGSGYQGTVLVSAVDFATGTDSFAVMGINSEQGLISSLPVTGLRWPSSQVANTAFVHSKVLSAAKQVAGAFGINLDSPPVTFETYSDPILNAFATNDGLRVLMTLAVADLMSDSLSEIAFVVAHEYGHVLQARGRRQLLDMNNRERDADQLAMCMLLLAGFDPYAGAGALAKLSMASGQAGLLSQNLALPPH